MATMQQADMTLLFLQSVQTCAHLVPAVLRWASPSASSCLDAIFAGDMSCETQVQQLHNTPVSNNMALLARLIVPGCDALSQMPMQPCEVSHGGLAVLDWLRRHVFPGLPAGVDIMHAVCYSSVLQAHQAQEACLAALLVSVTPSNSLSILEYATLHGLEELALRAFDSALGSFGEAAKSEPMTLAQLSPDTLLSLLQHDDLPCPEDVVVLSLLAWYNVDTTTRGPLLGPLAAACVRLSQLSIQQVEALDQHPQVSATTDGLRIVAGLYIGKIMGSPLPLGIGAGHKAALLAGPASDRPRRGWLTAQRQGLKGQPGKTCCEA